MFINKLLKINLIIRYELEINHIPETKDNIPYLKHNKYLASPLFEWDNFFFSEVGQMGEMINWGLALFIFILSPIILFKVISNSDKYNFQRYFNKKINSLFIPLYNKYQ